MVQKNSNRIEYSISVDWTLDYLLLHSIQDEITHCLHRARVSKFYKSSIKYDLKELRELIFIKRQILNHKNLFSA